MDTKTKNQDMLRKGSQWLRVVVLTLTTLGPIAATLLERVRQRANKGNQQATTTQAQIKGKVQAAQQSAQQRLEELTAASRQQAAAQAQQMQTQAQQLKRQADQLRKALRKETRQRAQLAKQARKDVLKRGEQITEDIKDRAETLTHQITKRGSQAAQDLSERGSQVTQEITKRTGKVAQNLSGRGGAFVQKRGRLLSIIGFSAGCVAAAAVTFIIVRRFVQQNDEQDQQIELPSNNVTDGTPPQSAGEIIMLNADGSVVTIIEPENEGE